MSNKFNLTFGCDPEYFFTELVDGQEFGVPVPYLFEKQGYPIIEADEQMKHPVLAKGRTWKAHMDGIAVELGVAPATSATQMWGYLNEAHSFLRETAYKTGLGLSFKPTVKYDYYKWFNPDSKLFSWCGIFGCDPDRDAIVEDYSSPEIDVRKHGLRYGGGHLHLSDNNGILKDYPIPAIRLLAIYVGCYTIANSPYPELEKQRAFRYGQPGRFRVQNYPNGVTGIEYRSPSNVWTGSQHLVEAVVNQAERAYAVLLDRPTAMRVMGDHLDSAISAIGNCDQQLAQSVLNSLP